MPIGRRAHVNVTSKKRHYEYSCCFVTDDGKNKVTLTFFADGKWRHDTYSRKTDRLSITYMED